jgi:hypothetical protein
LSNANFKQTVYDSIEDTNISPLRQLAETPPFPTLFLLSLFASKAYTDYKRRETDPEYETRFSLPEGWKLLTAASDNRRKGGYFGVAFWNPKHQQVVTVHRGTKLTNVGAIFTDINGVLFKHCIPQMCSAITFANKVVEVLREIIQEKGPFSCAFYRTLFMGFASASNYIYNCIS